MVVDLHGRLMCVDFNEYECVAIEMSPGEVQFKCGALPRLKERIVSYIDHIGRIEGRVKKLSSTRNWMHARNSDHRWCLAA